MTTLLVPLIAVLIIVIIGQRMYIVHLKYWKNYHEAQRAQAHESYMELLRVMCGVKVKSEKDDEWPDEISET